MNLTPADVRTIWSLLPSDCKTAIRTLRDSGQWERAKPAIMAEAEKSLLRLGKWSNLDCCHAIELAAQHYLVDNNLTAP